LTQIHLGKCPLNGSRSTSVNGDLACRLKRANFDRLQNRYPSTDHQKKLSRVPLLHLCSGSAWGHGPPQEKLAPMGGAVARVFPNLSLAILCPLKLSLAPLLARIWRRYCTCTKFGADPCMGRICADG